MSLSSQFSLSLELSKILPLGSLIPASSRALIQLVRDLQASGSDFVTEQDLAAVFGRNRIEPRFESTFRTAVKTSVVHRVVDIAELVIEGGAGPTVRRSLSEPAYFSTVVQLSLLIWTHDLGDLAKALAKSFERRAQQGQPKEYVPVPRFDAVKGTLRACREQTSGFMWELILSAVEAELYGHITFTDGCLYKMRPIPTVVLQVLMDSFTALQHLPENTLLRVRSMHGIPTIIVWAHHLLGLTVKVVTKRGEFIFGEGPEAVFIEGNVRGETEATLLNETKDVLFHLVMPEEDTILQPLSSHPLHGYGSRCLEMEISDEELLRTKVHETVSLAIERITAADKLGEYWSIRPSIHKIVEVSKELFPAHAAAVDLAVPFESRKHFSDSVNITDPMSQQERCERWISAINVGNFVPFLSFLIVSLTSIESLDSRVPLSTDGMDIHYHRGMVLPTSNQVLHHMIQFLQGPFRLPNQVEDQKIAAFSASGWTLCVSSVVAEDPSDARSNLTLVQGVPARGGERKRVILDGFSRRIVDLDPSRTPRNPYTPIAWPGNKCALTSWTRPRKTRYFIGVTDLAFEVAKVYECEPSVNSPHFNPETVRLGFRAMQEISWATIHLDTCEHWADLGQVVELPAEVVAFHGFDVPKYPAVEGIFVHAGLVPGDSSARWTLLCNIFDAWGAVPHFSSKHYRVVCLRGRNCCFACALDQAQKRRFQGGHVLLVL